MFNYRKAFLAATYKNGIPGKLTEEHKKVEQHSFTRDLLFKNTIIPKDLYVSQLIQYFLIIKAIETKLQNLSVSGKSEINAFFSLTYLEHLWRTPAIQKDLQLLQVDPEEIDDEEIALNTEYYIKQIEQLAPKELLAHFFLHVAGLMQNGNKICTKYIGPSNHITQASYQLPTYQYDFSLSAAAIEGHSAVHVFEHMMSKIDGIGLRNDEYQTILEQSKGVYETMSSIYDDLRDMHAVQPKLTQFIFAGVGVALAVFAIFFRQVVDYLTPLPDSSDSPRPS